ncbi:copper resistance D family protein [Jeotgalibacillus aurantiacus]|uniref:copper resistance D family protein n=1 Tax=Jeotgalibacillus aurantiacus TaxID=2763266 RepID=UPI001D0BA5F5|nr:CopD family protein [Jeotgalibacillus aurantiacus]
MMMYVAETLLYVSLSFLTGLFILEAVPPSRKPVIPVKREWIIGSTAAVMILSFIPLVPLIIRLSDTAGFSSAITTVLLDFTAGQSWVAVWISALLIVVITAVSRNRAERVWPNFFLLTALFFSFSWGSHPEAVSPLIGAVYHLFHLAALHSWTGILLVVAFFSSSRENWSRFLSWFTPVAMLCVVTAGVTGYLMADMMTGDFSAANAATTSYGHLLLLKLVFFIPVFYFAFANAFLIKRKLKDHRYSPFTMIRVEAIFLSVVFAVTSVLSKTAPPDPSRPMMDEMVQNLTGINGFVVFSAQTEMLVFIVSFLMFSLLLLMSFYRSFPAFSSFIFGMGVTASLYFSVLFSLS